MKFKSAVGFPVHRVSVQWTDSLGSPGAWLVILESVALGSVLFLLSNLLSYFCLLWLCWAFIAGSFSGCSEWVLSSAVPRRLLLLRAMGSRAQ